MSRQNRTRPTSPRCHRHRRNRPSAPASQGRPAHVDGSKMKTSRKFRPWNSTFRGKLPESHPFYTEPNGLGLDQPSRLVECKRRAAPTGLSGLKPGRLGFPAVVLRTSDRHRPQSWAGPAMSHSSPCPNLRMGWDMIDGGREERCRSRDFELELQQENHLQGMCAGHVPISGQIPPPPMVTNGFPKEPRRISLDADRSIDATFAMTTRRPPLKHPRTLLVLYSPTQA